MKNQELRNNIDLNKYATELVGLPTLKDIMSELDKPGRDPRDIFESFGFTDGIEKIEDVQPGMKLSGVVTNITAFGAFIDIGVHQDGLAHISQLSDKFIKDPTEAVKVHQKVMVTVLEVDVQRKRISLSLKRDPDNANKPHKSPQQQTTKRQIQKQKPLPENVKQQMDISNLQRVFMKNRT